MNTDIRLSVGFWQHPKTKKTVKRLGLEGIRSLQVLWLWAAVNRPDGVLTGMDWEDVELAADWPGDERAFFECCLSAEGASMWIDEADGVYILHDWAEHNPWQAEADARKESARKAAKARWGNAGASKAQKEKDADAMRSQCAGNAGASKAQCPSPFLSSPKPKGSKKESYDSSPEQSSIAAGSAAEKPIDAVITLILNTGEEHPVTQGEIDQWKDLYPSVDVLQALRNMKGWLIGNAKRRKTKVGIGRFIQAWLANEQNNPRASPSARIGPSRHGNAYADGRERDYGQSDFGALGGGK